MSHQCWLHGRHIRLACMRFDGTIENINPPLPILGCDVLQQVQNLNIEFWKELVLRCREKDNGELIMLS